MPSSSSSALFPSPLDGSGVPMEHDFALENGSSSSWPLPSDLDFSLLDESLLAFFDNSNGDAGDFPLSCQDSPTTRQKEGRKERNEGKEELVAESFSPLFVSSSLSNSSLFESSKPQDEEGYSKLLRVFDNVELHRVSDMELRTVSQAEPLPVVQNLEAKTGGGEDQTKKEQRLVKNREAAALSRERRKSYIKDLEMKCRLLENDRNQLRHYYTFVCAENMVLKEEVERQKRKNGAISGTEPAVLLKGSLPLEFLSHFIVLALLVSLLNCAGPYLTMLLIISPSNPLHQPTIPNIGREIAESRSNKIQTQSVRQQQSLFPFLTMGTYPSWKKRKRKRWRYELIFLFLYPWLGGVRREREADKK